MPISGAAPWMNPFPKMLKTSVMRKVTAAKARLIGSPNVAAPLPPAQFASALPIRPVPKTSRTAPEMNEGKITLSQSEKSTNTMPHMIAATMHAPM